MGTVEVRELAHYIVDRCTRDDVPVSNIQLQGMLYVMQLVRLKGHGEPLFDDEFHALPFGPAVTSVYHEYLRYGGRPIVLRYDSALDGVDGALFGWVDEGIRVLQTKSPYDIASVTRSNVSAWRNVWRHGNGCGMPITVDAVSKHANTMES